MMTALGWIFWLLILGIPLYLIWAKDPIHPGQGGGFRNRWTVIGVVILLVLLGITYYNLAGVPDELKSVSKTRFRQRAENTWKLNVSADELVLSEALKNFLLAEAKNSDPSVTAFEPQLVEYRVESHWLPVEYWPPRFFVVTKTYTGEMTTTGSPDKKSGSVRLISNADSKELQQWINALGGSVSGDATLERPVETKVPLLEFDERLKS